MKKKSILNLFLTFVTAFLMFFILSLTSCGNSGNDGTGESTTDGGSTTVGEEVHFNGRFDLSNPGTPRFDWSGTTIRARFNGTGISVVLKDEGGNNYFESIVDGVHSVFTTINGEQTFKLASGLSAGEHEVELVRRTEAFQGAVSFVGFQVDGGTLVRSVAPWKHKLEFIGDSITTGYGALGVGPSCSFSPATESAYVTWASVAARKVNASAHLIAWSGKGVYRNYGGDTNEPMPVLYERTIGTDKTTRWDFSYKADAVIIHLGGNDFSGSIPNQPLFETAYRNLLQQIRGHHPKAIIYCVVGEFLMTGSNGTTAYSYINDAITALADPGVKLLYLPGADAKEGFGCDWHPSAATHQRIGLLVADQLITDLGW